MSTFYALSTFRGDGEIQSMSEFEGKVVYATNVASKCGLTDREYDLFAKLGDIHGPELVILGFPSREFGGQEFQTDEEIAEFAASKNFPGILMKLGRVTGPGASELWKFFKRATHSRDPVWNFDGKFLVSRKGEVMLPEGDLEVEIARLIAEQ
jgi:glutathione peroxidase-family protein